MSPSALQALLLDLDDTLIVNPMDTFIPAYFAALERFVSDVVEPDRFIAELLAATRTMARNDGSGPSNEEVFAASFYPALGLPREQLEPVLERFYREALPQLRSMTAPRPAAPKILEWARDRGLKAVIATNPLFPRTAIEQRMAWGGLGVDRFRYDLVTSYENCHATKSSPAYYREILAEIGCPPARCLMVGDNWEWDIVNAAAAGIQGFWITPTDARREDPEVELAGQGTLDDFYTALVSGAITSATASADGRRAAR